MGKKTKQKWSSKAQREDPESDSGSDDEIVPCFNAFTRFEVIQMLDS